MRHEADLAKHMVKPYRSLDAPSTANAGYLERPNFRRKVMPSRTCTRRTAVAALALLSLTAIASTARSQNIEAARADLAPLGKLRLSFPVNNALYVTRDSAT